MLPSKRPRVEGSQDDDLITEFLNCITDLLSIDSSILKLKLFKLFPKKTDELDVYNALSCCEEMKATAKDLSPLVLESSMLTNDNIKNDMKQFVLKISFALYPSEGFSADYVFGLFSISQRYLNSLVKIASFDEAYEKKAKPSDEADDSLKEYEHNGSLIRNDPNFEHSRICELEKLLVDPKKYLKSKKFANNEKYDLSSGFVALAAPSMEGKTQSAFVFKDIIPLYFPLSVVTEANYENYNTADPAKTQRIYENYQSLSWELNRFALADLSEIAENHSPDESIGADSLKSRLSNFSSRVLGFLVALVEDARKRKGRQTQSWMRYHSERPKFSFNRVSIETTNKNPDFFKGFVLFLDEFVNSKWAIYVRNLSRVVRFTCLVANTNTKIANLVGTESCSGSTDLRIWSIVITSLGPTNMNFLNSQFNLSSSIIKIKENAIDPGVALFLDNFENEQINYLRPGMASFMAAAIVAFGKKTKSKKITLKDFLDYVLNFLSESLIFRKFDDPSQLMSQCAKIGLFLSESYESSPPNADDYSWFFSGSSFLKNHLYYLADPSDSHNWIILTSPPQLPSNRLRFVTTAGLLTWINERTFFNPGEIPTILACMFLAFGNTVTDILTRSKAIIDQNALNVADAKNRKAVQRKGNLLEVSTSISIIDSSQHSTTMTKENFNLEVFSLGGQNGLTFVNNLLINLLNVSEAYKSQYFFQLNFGSNSYKIENFLKNLKVPFLYSLNRADEFLDKLDSVSTSIYMKTFDRTANSEQIDGKFEIKCRNHEKYAVVECKNRKNKISSTVLDSIVKKCAKIDGSKLFLVFCDEIVSTPTSGSKFTVTCDKEKVNVYRINRSGNIFNISSFYENHKVPKYICIVFESSKINAHG